MNKVMRILFIVSVMILYLGTVRMTAQPVQHIITVSGDAEVKVVPDEVVLTMAVVTSNKDLVLAKNKNDERVKKVMSLAKDFKIDAKYIQTEYINIEPRYKDEYDEQKFLGYFVRKTVVITLKDISKFEDLLTGFLKAGVNYVNGVQFRTTELRKYRDQARSMAIKAAREKAEALTMELGVKLGKPVTIYENSSGWYDWYSYSWGDSYRGRYYAQTQNVTQNSYGSSEAPAGSMAPGQISVMATVSVTFEIE